MKSVKDIEDLSGKKVLVRVDLNVPMSEGKVLDDFRIKKAVPTILYLQKKGATVVLISHLGSDGTESMAPVAVKMKKYIKELEFIKTPLLSDKTEDLIKDLKSGSVVLLENLRSEPGEVKNSPSFARALSRYGEIFVNDAFSVSHRAHASVVGITKYLPGYAGFQMLEEIENLSQAFVPTHPFLFILGGAKFETKIPLIKRFLRTADTLFISGALANDFFRAKGYEVGTSLVEDGSFHISTLMKHKNLILPTDVEVLKAGKNAKPRFVSPRDVSHDESMVDVGPESVEILKGLIAKAKFILWNGPLGKYEQGFGGATEQLLKIISKSKAHSVIGGGDTVELISKLKLEDKLGFVSTGGGATLEFLAKGTLPGIKALK
jgi:phosphoglycerate kinase